MNTPFTLSGTSRLLCFIAFFAACTTQFLSAQISFAEKKVSSVDISFNGPKNVSESRIRDFMSVKPGQTFSYDALDDDVKRLYESGLVDDVRFLAEPIGESNVRIVAEVTTRSSLSAIDFVGNSVYSDKKLRDQSEMSSGASLNDAAILKGKRAIEKLYHDNGYPDALVSYDIESAENGFSTLVFNVDEGIKGEVDEIYFEGNQAYSDVELRREMKTKEKGIFSFITKSGQIDNATLEEDVQRVLTFYQNNGYLRAAIPGIQRRPKKNGMVDLVIPVTEGTKYTVSGVGFTGMKVFTYDEIWPALTLVKNDPYSAKKMRADMKMIRSYYGSKGYADARVIPDLKNTGSDGVTVNYRIKEGSRYRVGRVNIQGNNKTKDKVIRREVPLTPGEWFNSVDLDTTRNRLQNLNYFSSVQANASTSGTKGYRDVDINVSEKRTGSLGFGAGFSSIDSIVGYINLEQTNFDLMNPWGFTGGGQRFATSLRIGAERQDFKMSLTEPWFLGRQLAFGGEVYYENRQFISDEYDQRNWGGALFLRKPLGKRSYIRGEYRLENILIDEVNTASPAFTSEEGEYWRSALKFSYIFDSRDSNQTPRRGEKVDLNLTYAGGIIGGDVDAYTLNARGSKHFLLPYDFIFNLSGEATIVDSVGDEPIPIFERTFLGGARNLRGFEYRDVGSVSDGTRDDVTKETIGGGTSAYLTTEVTFPLVNTIRGAAFADFGFVNEDSYDFNTSGIHSDIGLGVRLKLPFGPFAVDYAIPIASGDQVEDGGRFQFYLDYKF